MNRHVNAIAGRLSLRPPQRQSLVILDRITELISLRERRKRNGIARQPWDLAATLSLIHDEYDTVSDFERDFPSLCFALATGVGKTRLMGAFISYLHLAYGIHNFFVLAPNLTIYNKLINDFTPNTPKYVFKGIAEFANTPPTLITGDNYETNIGTLFDLLPRVRINIFNISKLNSEVRGGKAPRIKRLSEYIGKSYFDHLARLDDLVLIMDESHRYRASAGVRAINELNPILGLELTATPYIESSKGTTPFRNIVYDYRLAQAMEDGFVKEPAVVTQKNFNPIHFSAEQLEQIKLEDGIRLHENVKVELETYARQANATIIKPFMLVIARDTTHAGNLLRLIQSDSFFAGRYRQKVIQVDSSKTGAEEDEMVQRLLAVEKSEEPTEIVIHVNMLKEGWDVTNLYTIVPLRAANARTLIEQSIGRGLRLPYGQRTKIEAIDTLYIVAHDKFQEIVDEAKRSDSIIRMKQVVLDLPDEYQRPITVIAQPIIATQVGIASAESVAQNTTGIGVSTTSSTSSITPIFSDPEAQQVARFTYDVIHRYQSLPTSNHLLEPRTQVRIIQEVKEAYIAAQPAAPSQLTLLKPEESLPDIDFAQIVAQTTERVVQGTIDIPRIVVQPSSEVSSGFHPFTLDLSRLNYQRVDYDLLVQHLRNENRYLISAAEVTNQEERLEDLIVRALIDFDDISYDDHCDLLYQLAGQTVTHFRAYLDESETHNVLLYYQKPLAEFIHAQMQAHYWENATAYDVHIKEGFTQLKPSAFRTNSDTPIYDFRQPVADKSKIKQMIFGGFQRCLYAYQKFQSDPERRFAIILDRDCQKWFRPVLGQFQIYYKLGATQSEYQPDFVAEADQVIYLCETKERKHLQDNDVQAKKEAAIEWCRHAGKHAIENGGKAWAYLLIPTEEIVDNMSLAWLAKISGRG